MLKFIKYVIYTRAINNHPKKRILKKLHNQNSPTISSLRKPVIHQNSSNEYGDFRFYAQNTAEFFSYLFHVRWRILMIVAFHKIGMRNKTSILRVLFPLHNYILLGLMYPLKIPLHNN